MPTSFKSLRLDLSLGGIFGIRSSFLNWLSVPIEDHLCRMLRYPPDAALCVLRDLRGKAFHVAPLSAGTETLVRAFSTHLSDTHGDLPLNPGTL